MRESFEQIRIDLTEKFQLDLDRQLEQVNLSPNSFKC